MTHRTSRGNLFAALLAPFSITMPAAAATVEIALENGTDPGLDVEGAVVSLLWPMKDPETGKARKKESRTIEKGGHSTSFEIPGALTEDHVSVSIRYKEGQYFHTNALHLGAAPPPPFKVYEPTEDPAAIVVTQRLVALPNPDHPGYIHVLELVRASNDTKRAYIGRMREDRSARASVILHVPENALDFEIEATGFFQRDFIERVGERVYCDVTIPDGGQQFRYSYVLESSQGRLAIERPLYLPVHLFEVAAPFESGYSVEVSGARFERQVAAIPEDPDQKYVSFTAMNLGADSNVTITLTASRSRTARDKKDEGSPAAWLWIAGSIASGLALGVAALLRPNSGPVAPGTAAGALREFLIDEIARLDIDHEAGKIGNEAYYQKKREALKKRLLDLG